MAWINTIGRPEPGSKLEHIYEEQKRQAGAVANILIVHSLMPEALSAHLDLYKVAMHTAGELSQREHERSQSWFPAPIIANIE